MSLGEVKSLKARNDVFQCSLHADDKWLLKNETVYSNSAHPARIK